MTALGILALAAVASLVAVIRTTQLRYDRNPEPVYIGRHRAGWWQQ